ncbi:MAG: hypothetical protein HQK66_12355, partial [Desulfamplus sp.]|nr:hypothetical protein [Desulfamplus sp.]
MKDELRKIFQIVPMALTAVARERDQTKLTRHIIKLNQENSIGGIINEVSECLKEILGYRLFAFAINKET